jgi:hypothetical protein
MLPVTKIVNRPLLFDLAAFNRLHQPVFDIVTLVGVEPNFTGNHHTRIARYPVAVTRKDESGK